MHRKQFPDSGVHRGRRAPGTVLPARFQKKKASGVHHSGGLFRFLFPYPLLSSRKGSSYPMALSLSPSPAMVGSTSTPIRPGNARGPAEAFHSLFLSPSGEHLFPSRGKSGNAEQDQSKGQERTGTVPGLRNRLRFIGFIGFIGFFGFIGLSV